jgi:RNA polymerase sigma-70 factor (family 1)
MKLYSTNTDQELTALLKVGDRHAFAEIYDRYGMMIYFKVNQMLRDEEAAKDLVQDVFLSLWLNAGQVKEAANLPGYLYVSSRNKVFNLIEKGKTRNDYVSSISRYANEASTETMDKLDERELMALIVLEIAKLPLKMRQVFEMSRLENLSHKEIAEKLGISEKTVKTQVHNALDILKVKLKSYGPGALAILTMLHKN